MRDGNLWSVLPIFVLSSCLGLAQAAPAVLSESSANSSSASKKDISRLIAYTQQNAKISGATGIINSSTQTTSIERALGYVAQNNTLSSNAIVAPSSRPIVTKNFTANIINSDWQAKSNAFTCTLTHNIPNFGSAIFLRKTGSDELFYIEPQGNVIFPLGAARIDTVPPLWRSDVLPLKLGQVVAVAGNQPIKLTAKEIALLVSPLSSGTKVMFTSVPINDMSNKNSSSVGVVRVALEPKKFLPAYKIYQQCITALVPYTFAQVSRLTFNYTEKAETLTPEVKRDLSKIALYMKADTQVLGVLIDSHSDNSGVVDANETISKQQAELVNNYLLEQGISADKINVRWHADKFAIANNKTIEGRAKNRRVTVRMETESTRKIIEQKALDAQIETEKLAEEKKATQDFNANAVEKNQKPASLTQKSPANAAINAATINSDQGKVTPEDVHKMVEGLDVIKN